MRVQLQERLHEAQDHHASAEARLATLQSSLLEMQTECARLQRRQQPLEQEVGMLRRQVEEERSCAATALNAQREAEARCGQLKVDTRHTHTHTHTHCHDIGSDE